MTDKGTGVWLRMPRKSVVRLTDRLDMSIVVHWDIKPQHNNNRKLVELTILQIEWTLEPTRTEYWYEPRHDKTNKMSFRLAKTQISLGIRPVWSVFALRLMGS